MAQDNLTREHILSEVRKLQYLYGLKREIRYGQTRDTDRHTESVAEHLYGMHMCAHYFLPLEDPERKLDSDRIFIMILFHDLDEIETGDTIAYLKTKEMYDNEAAASAQVIEKSPQHLQNVMADILTEYTTRETRESHFVKAIDSFEPMIQLYSDFGRDIFSKIKTTIDEGKRIKEPYLKPFPIMYQFYTTLFDQMIREGYFDHDEKKHEHLALS